MLMTLYQKSEIFAASRLTSFGEGPFILSFIRKHWWIENRLHYRRDVTLGEDASQVRSVGAPEVLAALNGGLLALLDFQGVKKVAKHMRHLCAQPREALQLLLSKLSRQYG